MVKILDSVVYCALQCGGFTFIDTLIIKLSDLTYTGNAFTHLIIIDS